MSITFWAPAAPITHTTMEECFCVIDGTPDESCTYCNGTGQEEISHTAVQEMNLSNSNAMAIQSVLGYEPDYCGTWKAAELGDVRQRIMRALNSERTRGAEVYGASDSRKARVVINEDGMPQIATGCRIIDCGRSDTYIVTRLAHLEQMTIAAQELGLDISWG